MFSIHIKSFWIATFLLIKSNIIINQNFYLFFEWSTTNKGYYATTYQNKSRIYVYMSVTMFNLLFKNIMCYIIEKKLKMYSKHAKQDFH